MNGIHTEWFSTAEGHQRDTDKWMTQTLTYELDSALTKLRQQNGKNFEENLRASTRDTSSK